MARFIVTQRRVFLVFFTLVFTCLIRLMSISMGNSLRDGRHAFSVTEKGPFKQATLRLKAPSRSGSYLVRLANFYPFIMFQTIGNYAGAQDLASRSGAHLLLAQCGGDCDCDCGGDCGGDCFPGDCDCDCECGGNE